MLQFLGEARRGQKMLYVGLYLHIKIPSNLDPLVTFFTLLKIKYIITTKQKKIQDPISEACEDTLG